MAHAGTPTDLARQPATSTVNGLWQALLIAVVLLALVAGTVFVGTNLAAKGSVIPAADHRYDQIEAHRGAVTLSTDNSLNSVFDNAHATPYIAGPALSTDEYLNNILDRSHATPFTVSTVTPQVSATSGTFHPGWQPVAPVKRDRIGGQ